MMEVLKFIILTWLASFVPAAYCQMGNFSEEAICNITIFNERGNPRTVLKVLQFKMIDRCPENYTNETIITSCEHFNALESLNLIRDFFRPVTDNITNITYVNQYCAHCNNYEYTFGSNWAWTWGTWSPYSYLRNACENYTSEMKASEVNDLDKWTQTFINKGMTLKSSTYLKVKELECSGKKNWPIKLLDYAIPCLVENFEYGQEDRLKSCQYFDKNDRSCMKMRFIIEPFSIYYGSHFYEHLSQINLTGGDYIVETVNQDIFYMCRQIYQAGYWGKILRIFISIAFLCAYLIMNYNKRYFEILSNQLLYVYSIGLIIMSVLLTYIYLKFPVSNVSLYLVKIFWTYHFLCTVLNFIVFCNLAFCKCIQWENITKGYTNTCYLSILFVVGLLLPVSFPLMYLYFLSTYENQCPLIPGHTAVPVVSPGNLEFMKFVLDTSLSYLMPIMFVVGLLCSLIDMSCDPGEVRSFKMVLIMGIHCILYKLYSGYYGNENTYTVIGLSINMDMVAQFSIDIHGVLVFFVFLTENTMVNDILIKHGYKRGNTTQQNCNGATETTVQFQS